MKRLREHIEYQDVCAKNYIQFTLKTFLKLKVYARVCQTPSRAPKMMHGSIYQTSIVLLGKKNEVYKYYNALRGEKIVREKGT